MAILLEFLHNGGFILGTGLALALQGTNILSWRDKSLRPAVVVMGRIFPRLIWIGIVAMLIVHTFELIQEQSLLHWVKEGVIVGIAAIGLWLTYFALPGMRRLRSPLDQAPSQEFVSLQRRTRVLTVLVLLLWAADYVLNSIYFEFVHHG